MKSRSALVIGGSGLLGRGVARELLGHGWDTSILSRGITPLPTDLSTIPHRIADRRDAQAFAAALDELDESPFDLVIDCAAYTASDARSSITSLKSQHYVFIGTDFVYSPDPAARFPIPEEAPKLSGLPYADGKLAAEDLLLASFRDRKFPVTILRLPHILGDGRTPGCDPAAGGRDPNLTARIQAGESIPLLAGGQFLIQPVWSREVGQALHHLAGRPETFGQIYNLAGPECVTTRHYYEILAELLGSELHFQSVDADEFCRDHPEKSHIARHRIYDTRKIQSTGYVPHLALREAIQETIQSS